MAYEWIDSYCLKKLGVEKDYKEEWKATRYSVGGKMFVMMCEDNTKRAICTVKLEPDYGEMLRQVYNDIVPGYYMNKQHWNSLYLEGYVPDDIVKDMLDRSYRLIFDGLTVKMKKEIQER